MYTLVYCCLKFPGVDGELLLYFSLQKSRSLIQDLPVVFSHVMTWLEAVVQNFSSWEGGECYIYDVLYMQEFEAVMTSV